MKNSNPTKIGKDIITKLYTEILLRWEIELQYHPHFDIRSKKFKEFKNEHSVKIEVVDKINLIFPMLWDNFPNMWEEKTDFFVFSKGDSNQPRKLFKCLRNAIAHGHVHKKSIGNKHYLLFVSRNTGGKSCNTEDKPCKTGNIVMVGQLEIKKLTPFISALNSTAKP